MRDLYEENTQLRKCLSELLCWLYPWKTPRRSKVFIEEAMRGFKLIGRKHPFVNVADIERRLK